MTGLIRRLLGWPAPPLWRRGEDAAAQWLRRRGYRILRRNLPLLRDEADIVALDPDGCTIVIVEVKAHGGTSGTAPEHRVTRAKQARLARLAARLQRSQEYRGRPFRFDAMGVIIGESGEPVVRHHPGAFQSPW